MTIEWKDDASPLHVFELGMSATVGRWTIRVDKMKPWPPILNEIVDGVRGDLTERERQVLDMRFKDDEEAKARRARSEAAEALDKSHPWAWTINVDPSTHDYTHAFTHAFTHMGGRAPILELAQLRAEAAVAHGEKLLEFYWLLKR